MRVDQLKSISNTQNPKHRTVVKLCFQNEKDLKELILGSAIVDEKRVYYYGNVIISREKFLQVRTDQLKFAKETFCWNISQHAVQEIVSYN